MSYPRFRIGAGSRFHFDPKPLFLFIVLGILLGIRASSPPPASSAATLPTGFTETRVAADLTSPTAMAIAPDGRIFVCLQGGAMRVVKNGALLPTPFVSLSVNSIGERGLLGVAFDPDFENNQYVYAYYTPSATPLRNRVSRFTASGDVAAAESETIILDLDNLNANSSNHNGGAIHFGPDGRLYVAVGDSAISSNSQTLANPFGKILRINADGSIPADNPFYNTATGKNRAIWALGLRNPYTFGIQPGTGRIFVNDVGEAVWEEIDEIVAGGNYGWPTCEGACNPPNPNFRDPIYAYSHASGGCAITGAAFYNPATPRFPAEYVGKYFFGDYCGGWIRRFDPATGTVSAFATGLSSLVDLDVSANGDLYYLQRGGGQLWRIEYTASQSPVITQHPNNQTVTAGRPASFSVSATGTPPLNYQWQRDGENIPGATSATYAIAATALGDNGARFRCIVTNGFGAATSNEATLTVTTNQAPVAAITTPTVETLYQGGQTISYSGTGTDPETGALPPGAFTWQVEFHHDTHTHPFVPATSGVTGGSFVIPRAGETSANVWYRIHLTVTDSLGSTHSVYRDIHPRISTITLQSNPSGLLVTLDGQPTTTPASFQSVVGIERTLGVITPQNADGESYGFASWSDGGQALHTIVTPPADAVYTATFVTASPGLQFYPLARPVRLLDTRAGASPNACSKPGAQIPGGTARTQQARGVCEGLTIPANARAITGNITTVQSGGGFLTLFPSDVSRPTVANSNYGPNEILNNVFTVGLGAVDGAFNIHVTTNTDVVVDVTGYYAPPGAGGLYFHPLPRPVRLLDTRAGFAGCYAPGMPLAGAVETTQQATGICAGLTIPANAKAIVGNATTVNPQGTGDQFFTLFPADAARPLVASSNYRAGQIMNGPFTVGLSPGGAFKVFPTTQTDLVIDVAGYYSPDATDGNGAGLLFYPLPRPGRLLDTRAGFSACSATNAALPALSTRLQPARDVCVWMGIASDALAIVGNATVVGPLADGWLTFWPSDATKPTVAQSNYATGQVFNRHFIVGLGNADGAFNIFTRATTHLVVDMSGYFAP